MGGSPAKRSLRRSDFRRITRQRRRVVTDYFLVFSDQRVDREGPRLGITVTRRVGNSVRRNRIKRLVREWFRQRSHRLRGRDLVVIAKRDIPRVLRLQMVADDLDRWLEL
jgi:ribonuclease P protein component